MALHVADRPRPHGGMVRTLTIARPERRNALNPDHLIALRAAIQEAQANAAVRVVVITGEGTSFCAGYDLSVPLAVEEGAAPDALVLATMAEVHGCSLPILARVNGPAFGAGLDLAISCDLRIASEEAKFCLPASRLGIAYAPEGIARLAALIGTSGARHMAYTAETILALNAVRMGLVNEVVGASDLDSRVAFVADAIADAAPMAVRAMKRTLNAFDLRLSDDARRLAEEDRLACYASEDAQEGLAAFLARRPPAFRNR